MFRRSASARKWSEGFFTRGVCPECKGDRLNREALHYFIDGKNIADLCRMDIAELYLWSLTVEDRLDPTRRIIASEILKEIRSPTSTRNFRRLLISFSSAAPRPHSRAERASAYVWPRSSEAAWSMCSISSMSPP